MIAQILSLTYYFRDPFETGSIDPFLKKENLLILKNVLLFLYNDRSILSLVNGLYVFIYIYFLYFPV